jgi:NAD(P)-dependent dehydrogenase (short-subunit alcohol dehydrogenase family)
MELRGSGALVTGGASGLGLGTARELAKAGAVVTIVDLDERGAAAAAELGASATFARVDVANTEDVTGAIETATRDVPLRIVVNCAGVIHGSRIVKRDGTAYDLDAFERTLRVNVVGTFNVLRLAAVVMAKNEPLTDGERGVIVNTSSVAAFEGQIGQAAYASSKGAVHSLTICAARDLAEHGIRVCSIAPGTFETPMIAGLPDAAKEALAAAVPFPSRLGRPEEYAALVRHICENRMLNGETIRLDAAIRMPPK